jgi:hypothetical protein
MSALGCRRLEQIVLAPKLLAIVAVAISFLACGSPTDPAQLHDIRVTGTVRFNGLVEQLPVALYDDGVTDSPWGTMGTHELLTTTQSGLDGRFEMTAQVRAGRCFPKKFGIEVDYGRVSSGMWTRQVSGCGPFGVSAELTDVPLTGVARLSGSPVEGATIRLFRGGFFSGEASVTTSQGQYFFRLYGSRPCADVMGMLGVQAELPDGRQSPTRSLSDLLPTVCSGEASLAVVDFDFPIP